MSISPHKRMNACLRLIRNDFDIEGTVAWVMREYADDPAMQQAKHKEKLARNIITIGGSGDQQYMNLAAFKDALRLFEDTAQKNRELVFAEKLSDTEANNNRLAAQVTYWGERYEEKSALVDKLHAHIAEMQRVSILRLEEKESTPA